MGSYNLTTEHIKKFLLKFGLNKKLIDFFIQKYSREYLEKKILLLHYNQRHDKWTDDTGAWIRKAIEDNYKPPKRFHPDEELEELDLKKELQEQDKWQEAYKNPELSLPNEENQNDKNSEGRWACIQKLQETINTVIERQSKFTVEDLKKENINQEIIDEYLYTQIQAMKTITVHKDENGKTVYEYVGFGYGRKKKTK